MTHSTMLCFCWIGSCDFSTKPTTEEVKGWSQSFDKLMKNPAGRSVFGNSYGLNTARKISCHRRRRVIYEDYISILSPKEVSLDSRVREGINRKMQEPSTHTFDDAQLQIYTLMHRDSYPRFLNSAIYKALLQNVSRSSSES
uniref:Regulator of G protein signaling 19 n=1 Tax=Naja naja TaxID=35670 RepID=A0A8C6X2C2_NAJNA